MMKHSQLFLCLHSSLQHPLQESRKCYYLHFSAEKMRKCGIKVRLQVSPGEIEAASPVNHPQFPSEQLAWSCPGQGQHPGSSGSRGCVGRAKSSRISLLMLLPLLPTSSLCAMLFWVCPVRGVTIKQYYSKIRESVMCVQFQSVFNPRFLFVQTNS